MWPVTCSHYLMDKNYYVYPPPPPLCCVDNLATFIGATVDEAVVKNFGRLTCK